jgi:hypothetical protein
MPMSHEVEIQDVLSGRARYTVLCARVESIEPLLPDGCASLMPVDGPYHGQKGDPWDNQQRAAAEMAQKARQADLDREFKAQQAELDRLHELRLEELKAHHVERCKTLDKTLEIAAAPAAPLMPVEPLGPLAGV